MKKKIWIADPDVVKPALDLIPAGVKTVVNSTGRFLTEQELIEGISDVDGIVAGVEPYTRRVLEAAGRLKIIARRGVGFSEIDLKAATERGIYVTITPVAEEIAAVADLTLGLILNLLRKITPANEDLRERRWRRSLFTGINLRGKRVGIVGMGRIGKAVAQRLKGFEVKLAYYDPYVPSVDPDVEEMDFERLLTESDIITIHSTLTDETKDLFTYEKFKLMKRGSYLINTARAAIVKEEDLLRALDEGLLAGAALDVYSEVPPKKEILRKLIDHPKVLAVPYSGAFTEESLLAMDTTAVKNVLKALEGEIPDHIVNVEVLKGK